VIERNPAGWLVSLHEHEAQLLCKPIFRTPTDTTFSREGAKFVWFPMRHASQQHAMLRRQQGTTFSRTPRNNAYVWFGEEKKFA
jgi:hypothetical protein